jgi:hypothetical protein
MSSRAEMLAKKLTKLSDELQQEYILLEETVNCSKDGIYYICNSCFGQIVKEKLPKKNEKDMMEWANFPESLFNEVEDISGTDEVLLYNASQLDVKDPDMLYKRYKNEALLLNKLEAFILKLVIPFIRVAHCKRGRYLMVKGNLILIASDIPNYMSKILPSEQQLLPVSFKRKLTYKGSFMEEWVDVKKVKCYFNWFKKHNPWFKDIELNEDLINEFQNNSIAGVKRV